MHLGLGLYRHMLTPENFRFARQIGATHIVAHLVDYFRGDGHGATDNQPTGTDRGWGLAGDPDRLWTVDELVTLRRAIEAEGLRLEAIENLDPAHWYDVLLDGPRRAAHIQNVVTLIGRLGEAGIPILGYNFSLAGVAGRVTGPSARGGATSVGMEGPVDAPMPKGMVWNMVVDAHAPAGTLPAVAPDELWRRVAAFLREVIPAAERAGVRLAAHPDDPPLPSVRGQPRLVYRDDLFQRMIDLHPSPANQLEFCVGTLAEMPDADVYETIGRCARQQRIAYVHLRNVAGKAPHYRETFIDDGDVDMTRVLRTLQRNGFDGVIIPDHTPQPSCAAPWHAGMAHALGWIRGALQSPGGRADSLWHGARDKDSGCPPFSS
jgi:mannonate dehydratase